MMNKYLQKISSWEKIPKFIGDLTGKHSAAMKTKLNNVKDFVAKGETVSDLEKQKILLDRAKVKARVITGGVAAAGATAAGYGYHRARKKQKAETMRQYETLFKSASVAGAAKDLGKGVLSGVLRTADRGLKKALDVVHTANGGKIRTHAHVNGMKYGEPAHEAFMKKKPLEQIKAIKASNPKAGNQFRTIGNLYKQRRDARITLGATATAAGAGYVAHKNALEKKKILEQGY